MPNGFEVRGVIEGFYGPPWSDTARRRAVDFLAERGMNAYVHAPKGDPRHRLRWREPYSDDELRTLLDFAGHCRRRDVRFGYGISPALDLDPTSRADQVALTEKLAPFVQAGIDWIVLGFDDVPSTPDAGHGHAAITSFVREWAPAVHLSVVPTDYVGIHPSPYLAALCESLPGDVDVMWTGRTVVAPEITRGEAEARRAATAGQPLLVWDNYPVNDAFMTASLHLGPLRHRDPELVDVCRGWLANPMLQPMASLLPLATVADYALEPRSYDPDAAWERAIEALGGDDPTPLRALARACAASLLDTRPDVPLHHLLDRLDAGDESVLPAIREDLDASLRLPDALDDQFATEVQPWSEQGRREAEAGLAALALLDGGHTITTWSGIMGVMAMLFLWSEARGHADHTVFGPRFACAPAIIQLSSGAIGVDPEALVVEDHSAIDRLCRMVLSRIRTDPS